MLQKKVLFTPFMNSELVSGASVGKALSFKLLVLGQMLFLRRRSRQEPKLHFEEQLSIWTFKETKNELPILDQWVLRLLFYLSKTTFLGLLGIEQVVNMFIVQ
jgi:hypothetical protein